VCAVRQTVTADDGQRVSYLDHGGSGPAVLLLHGHLMDADMFAPQVAALGESYRLIAMDLRGHGGTPADGGFTYWDLARDALGLLDRLGVARCAVVGAGEGGFVAMRLPHLAPDRIRSLALLGTSAADEEPEMGNPYWRPALAWRDDGPTDEVLDLTATLGLGAHDAGEWKARWRRLTWGDVFAVLIPMAKRDGMVDHAPDIRCPVLVLHGSADAVHPVTAAHQLADAFPGAGPPVIIGGGSHFPSLTDADEVNPHLLAFLDRTAGH